MTAAPKRVQRSRAKGWKMPEGAVYVGRPTFWGNPWTVADLMGEGLSEGEAREAAVESYAAWLRPGGETMGYPACAVVRVQIVGHVSMLRGRSLACWCALDQPCHADVLLELANAPLRCEAATARPSTPLPQPR